MLSLLQMTPFDQSSLSLGNRQCNLDGASLHSHHNGNVGMITDGVVEKSLSDLFADDEEKFDIFGERSMAGSITTLLVDDDVSRVSRGTSSLKSVKSAISWQGSCESFIGAGDELLDFSGSVNDLFASNSDLALDKQGSTKRRTKTKRPEAKTKNPSSKRSAMKQDKSNRNLLDRPSVVSRQKSQRSRASNEFKRSASTSDLSYKSPDQAPRHPARGLQMIKEVSKEDSLRVNAFSSSARNKVSAQEDLGDEEVIVFNLVPKKPQNFDSFDSPNKASPAARTIQGSSSLLMSPMSVRSLKEDDIPRRPRRSSSPTRDSKSVIPGEIHLAPKESNAPRSLKSGTPKIPQRQASNDGKVNQSILEEIVKSPTNGHSKEKHGGSSGDPLLSSPKKRLMKIALKDMEFQLTPPEGGRSSKSPISLSPTLRCKKLVESRCKSLKNGDGKLLKFLLVSGNKEVPTHLSSIRVVRPTSHAPIH
jgi:hypothetical protein